MPAFGDPQPIDAQGVLGPQPLAPQPPQGLLNLPAPPPQTGGGLLGEIASNIQSHIDANRAAAYQRQIAMAQAQAQYAGLMRYRNDLDPAERDLFDAAPFPYVDQQVKNRQLQKLAGGESAAAPGSKMITAPLLGFDPAGGQGYVLTPQGGSTVGPRIPGETDLKDGVIYNKRGPVEGNYALPQNYPQGNTFNPFVPSVTFQPPAGGQPPAPDGAQPPPQAQTDATGDRQVSNVIAPAGLRHLSAPQQAFAARILGNSAVQGLSPEDQRTLVGVSYAESGLGTAKDRAGHAATGPFQMQAKWFPGVNLADPDQQVATSANVLQQNRVALTHRLGRAPTPSEIYMGFMQGPTGSAALLTAPAGETAVNALIKAGVNPRTALQSITGNAGRADMSASDFIKMWDQRFQNSMSHVWGGGAQAATQAGAPAAADGRSTWTTGGPQPGQPPVVSAQAQGVNADAAGGPPAPVTFRGSSQGVIPGRTNETIPPAEAIRMGLAPGIWQRTPTGEVVQKSKPPPADMDQIASLQATVNSQQALAEEQDNFMRHNNNTQTGWLLGSPTIPHVGEIGNPFAAYGESHDPGVQGMEASHGKQVLMVKPDNAGARILQSELPFWEPQTQGVDKTPDVNRSIAQETRIRADKALARLNFFNTWIYNRGNLLGAQQAFENWQRSRNAQRNNPQPQGQVQSSGAAANDPLGIR